jgi:hypothetical protein
MASPNNMPNDPVIIEYDGYRSNGKMIRKRKQFTNYIEARAWYKSVIKQNPKVINPKKESKDENISSPLDGDKK